MQTAFQITPAGMHDAPSDTPEALQAKESMAFILDELGLSNADAAEHLGVETFQVSAWRAASSGKHFPLYMVARFVRAFGPALLECLCERCGFRCVVPAVAEAGKLALGIAQSGRRVLELSKEGVAPEMTQTAFAFARVAPEMTQTAFAFAPPAAEPPATIQQRFEAFHEHNPEVYAAMVAICRRLKLRGHKRYGVKAVWEMLRITFTLERPDEIYKLNNNYTSRYARLIMDREADLAGFFETRELKSA